MRPLCVRSLGVRSLALSAAALGVFAGSASAQLNQNYLQWYELEWDDMERRAADLFMAGYDAVWLPPPTRSSYLSVGYDVFDRFDLGKPPLATIATDRARTTYGTEGTFRAMVQELQRAGVEVYVDGVFNHNNGRTTSDAFLAAGGYPGFWIPREDPPRDKLPTDDWGDFHGGNQFGYLQSENPGGPNYDLELGDLVALVDIAQESNNQFIRHPVMEGDPDNIPGGPVFNVPDPNNARFYPDQSLTPETIMNPGTSRNPGTLTFTRYPYNTVDPLAGDAVTDNGTGLLMRWAQWMLEVQGVDGFRLDALKHTPSWFWDGFYDSAVHMGRTRPDGVKVNPFSFGESVTGNSNIINNYVRQDSFASRDALDLQGAARLRDLLNGGGFGSWADLTSSADSSFLDFADDGFINGSLGVNHVFSHDNGTVGNGSSLPPLPTVRQQGHQMHAFMLMRPGRAIVYHNTRGIPLRSSGFFPREGAPLALGWNPSTAQYDDTITTLVRLRNEVGSGFYIPLNGNINDVIVYERALNGIANCVVGVNDRFDPGFLSVTVDTSYAQGTRLHEMTGNAADPVVDPNNDIPETIVVGANGVVTINVPNNASSAGEHGKGYVVYAEALPEAEMTIVGESGTIAPDDPSLPDWFQRLSEISVVTSDSFDIRIETSQADLFDPNTDDNALFAINDRTQDWNGNGSPDIAYGSLSVVAGFEEFVDINQPLFGSGGSMGVYQQGIDATQMDEGMNYITAVVFKKRPANSSPMYRQLKKVVYVDRAPAEISLDQAGMTFEETTVELTVRAHDRTTERLYLFVDLEEGEDPLTMLTTVNQVPNYDRFEYRRTTSELAPGEHTITMVAVEPNGRTNVVEETITIAGAECPADLDNNGTLNFGDVTAFLTLYGMGDPAVDLDNSGSLNFGDVTAFLTLYGQGCP